MQNTATPNKPSALTAHSLTAKTPCNSSYSLQLQRHSSYSLQLQRHASTTCALTASRHPFFLTSGTQLVKTSCAGFHISQFCREFHRQTSVLCDIFSVGAQGLSKFFSSQCSMQATTTMQAILYQYDSIINGDIECDLIWLMAARATKLRISSSPLSVRGLHQYSGILSHADSGSEKENMR